MKRPCRHGARAAPPCERISGMVTPAEVKLDADKAKDWLSKGAQPTETVKSLFKKNGILA